MEWIKHLWIYLNIRNLPLQGPNIYHRFHVTKYQKDLCEQRALKMRRVPAVLTKGRSPERRASPVLSTLKLKGNA